MFAFLQSYPCHADWKQPVRPCSHWKRDKTRNIKTTEHCGITDWPSSRALPPTLSECLCWFSARSDDHLTHNVLTCIRKMIGSNLKQVIDYLSHFPVVFLSTSRQIWEKYLDYVTASPKTFSIGVHQESHRSMLEGTDGLCEASSDQLFNYLIKRRGDHRGPALCTFFSHSNTGISLGAWMYACVVLCKCRPIPLLGISTSCV